MLNDNSQKSLEAELRKTLAQVLDRLIDSGLVNVGKNDKEKKSELINNVVATLTDPKVGLLDLSKDRLKDNDVLTSLGVALMAEHNPKNNKNKLEYAELFKDKELTPEDKSLMKKVFEHMFEKKLEKNPSKKNELDEKLEQIAKMMQGMHKENQMQLKKDLSLMKALMDIRRMDYGVDTQNPGGLLTVVQAVVAGNQTGRMDLSPSGNNFMGKMNEANTGIPDPIGVKFAATVHNLADGVINSTSEVNLVKTMSQALGVPIYNTPQNTM